MMAAIASGVVAAPGNLFSQSLFDEQFFNYPTYNGEDLELSVDAQGTHFKLWSPKAQEVMLNLYEDGHTGTPYKEV